ncbi:hypothetical protein Tco_0682697 [Tanacetum coccineum]|uniref:Uncharacterized protein n=1 Tax=Tanacetum coccineum TaxID=301880 RepID=A0ABQ4XRY9_9ASTR
MRRKLKCSRKKMHGKKKAGKEQQQESSKRQRMEDDKETDEHEKVEEVDEAELKKHLVIVKDDDIAIDAIPLATKPPVIVENKLLKRRIIGPGILVYPKKKTKERMVDSQPMEEEFWGVVTRDVGTKTHKGPTEPVLQMKKTHSPSPAFIKENIDVLRTMIKEHDQQAKMKATLRNLAYIDSDKESPAGSLARGFSDRFSLELSSTSNTRKQTHFASKSRRIPSKNKEPTRLRRSRRLED